MAQPRHEAGAGCTGVRVPLNAVCLLVAGALRATLPAGGFTLEWEHSVEKTRWEEDYRVERGALVLVESRVQGFGAGMEPAPDAKLVDGTWRWQPRIEIPELRLTSSGYTADYRLCWSGSCTPLRAMAHSTAVEVVSLMPCTV